MHFRLGVRLPEFHFVSCFAPGLARAAINSIFDRHRIPIASYSQARSRDSSQELQYLHKYAVHPHF